MRIFSQIQSQTFQTAAGRRFLKDLEIQFQISLLTLKQLLNHLKDANSKALTPKTIH